MKGRLTGAVACLILFVSIAAAQTYPTRQITLVVPFAPGGPADFLGRLIGQKMSEELGQQIVVDNRPGANTIIGAQAVAKAAPDGYTLLMAIDGTLVMNPFLYSKLAYDPFKDFAPISVIALVPSAVVGNIKIPIDSIKELVDREKAKPGTFQIGISTPTSQVNVGLLNMMAGPISPPFLITAAPRRSPASLPAILRSAWRASMCRCRCGARRRSRFSAW